MTPPMADKTIDQLAELRHAVTTLRISGICTSEELHALAGIGDRIDDAVADMRRAETDRDGRYFTHSANRRTAVVTGLKSNRLP